MNAEIINHFIEGTKNVLGNVCGVESTMGKPYLKDKLFEDKLNITIGIVGDVKGKVNYAFDEQVALFLASKMMFMEVTSLDEMSKSAICELSNMISGGIATVFSNNGKFIDITPPKFEQTFSNYTGEKFISIPLELDQNKLFEVNVWVEE